jgi:hypothetical protein
MREYMTDFRIDGKPILVPDCDITLTLTDLDDADSGRDEAGIMHRIVLREGVRTVPLPYHVLTAEEYLYMESLFRGKPEFTVTCRDLAGRRVEFRGYRAKHSITIHNARTGICKNYNFNIVEC